MRGGRLRALGDRRTVGQQAPVGEFRGFGRPTVPGHVVDGGGDEPPEDDATDPPVEPAGVDALVEFLESVGDAERERLGGRVYM